ncbi:MAG TPA: NAD(P)H-hydrate dehydratase [Gemmatimonadota bacterium]|nr:NAD(P)H-hydrate dehydratase [Gemmatimonadota bacterium]
MTGPFPGPPWCLPPDRIAAVDRAAIGAGLSGAALMETAGGAVAAAIRARWPEGRIVVFAGGGNNGGDGLVAARHLRADGRPVDLALFFDPSAATGDAALQWRLVEGLGLPTVRVGGEVEARQAVRAASGAACVVDALLGTGLAGDVREPMRSAIEALDESPVPVVAVDAPSGLDGASGRIRGAAARAEITVTFGFPKPGLFLVEGPRTVGRLHVVPLGYPAAALAAAGERPLTWIRLAEAAAALPPRRHDTHKGRAGRLLVVAGSERFRGAAALTATAALRAGAGVCVVAAPEPVAGLLLEALPEAIVVALPRTKSGVLGRAAAARVAEAAAEADAVAVGPGLTTAAGVRGVVEAALGAGIPAVVDADALNVLAADPTPVGREAATILTPHPGELGRWLDRPAAEVDRDRVACAGEAARRWGARVVLKGSPTVVAGPDGEVALNLTGNPGLAKGGSGDVLTGLLGSLLAQGVAPALAARAAPCLHGLAADWARFDLGERGMTPGDLFRYLPLTIREVSAGRGAELLARLDHRHARLLAGGA